MKHKNFTRRLTASKITQHWNTRILHEDSLQARQQSIETQEFYMKIHSKQDNTALKHEDFYRKIHSKQDNTTLKHKDFTWRFTPSKTTQHWNTNIFTWRFTPSKITQHWSTRSFTWRFIYWYMYIAALRQMIFIFTCKYFLRLISSNGNIETPI